jgi:thioredoxin 2
MMFIPLKDAQEAQFLKDNDAILNDRARLAANPRAGSCGTKITDRRAACADNAVRTRHESLNMETIARSSRVLIACTQCATANRVPAERLAESPVCGKCGAALLDGKPAVLDEANFDTVVGRTELPVLVDFWAPWCAPCRAMAPALEAAAAELRTKVRFAKVNTDEAQALAARMRIRGIPTLALFLGGREAGRVSGAMDKRSLLRWIAEHA